MSLQDQPQIIVQPGDNIIIKTVLKVGTGPGNVNGPVASTNNAVALWDGTDGELLKNSSIIVDGSSNITGPNNITAGGTIAGVNGTFSSNITAVDVTASGIVTTTNTGLHTLDTNASHDLIWKPGSDLSQDRTFTLTTGDNDRTLDISAANVTISAAAAGVINQVTTNNMLTALGGVGLTEVATLTNKTIDLADNTITGTAAEFDTACSDDDFAFLGLANVFTQDNIINGLTIGRGLNNHSTNTALGRDALSESSSGATGNTGAGNGALQLLTTGDDNTALGSGALNSITSQSRNTAIGKNSGQNLISGNNNTFVGDSSGAATITGTATLTTGNRLTLIGENSMTKDDDETFSFAIGQGSTTLGTGTGVIGTADVTRLQAYGAGFNRGHLGGCKISNNLSDATNDIDIAPGEARDCTNARGMVLSSGLTKRLDATWVAGTNQGGLDYGTIANATYHVHLIEDPTTVTTDCIFSLSTDAQATITMTIASPAVVTWGVAGSGHGLVSGSTVRFSTTGALPTGVTAGTTYYVISTGLTETTFQFSSSAGGAAVNTSGTQSGVQTGQALPLLPSGYTYFRRIASIIRSSGAILQFTQIGDKFLHPAPVVDVSAVATGTSAQTKTLTVPLGLRVEAFGSWSTNSASVVYFSSLDQTDIVAAVGTGGLTLPTGYSGPWGSVSTNSSAQIRTRANINMSFTLTTYGWIDTRGGF